MSGKKEIRLWKQEDAIRFWELMVIVSKIGMKLQPLFEELDKPGKELTAIIKKYEGFK